MPLVQGVWPQADADVWSCCSWQSFEDDATTVELSNHVISMTARLSSLERHYSQLRTAVTTSKKSGGETVADPHSAAPSHSASSQTALNEPEQIKESAPAPAPEPVAQNDFSGLPSHDMVEYGLESSMPLQDEYGPLPVPEVLSQEEASRQEDPTHDDPGVLEGFLPPGPSPVMIKDVDPFQAEREVRMNNGASFRPAFDIFFRRLNPLHPLLNENQFRAQFDNFVFDQGRGLSELDHAQLLALVNLIQAEVEILIGDCSDSDAIFGWREFCTADSILQDLIWKGKANLMTIQCLLLKARYLMYLERYNQAYDMMATAVRICMQLGLHDQSRWAGQGADPFETIMRQRVFYSLFTLERAVALSCGLPPTLRQCDFCVDTPPALDDRGLFPNRPLPEETPELSFVPYFVAIIKWAELCGDVWDGMLHMRAVKPVSEAQIAALDRKILDQVNAVHPQLQWKTERSNANRGRLEPYVWRQKVMYRVVCSFPSLFCNSIPSSRRNTDTSPLISA
ncbi:hypothetical protein A1O3_03230 [Capronia epimyces CBS 606.96]|uniref:Xylanolytic transcriptional activator regulatory domain-containing protein n=1 Tax=Capronia epimyces CBS 606.96 TaxID=1182542 RepID=W9YLN8_9EURO|nr:uncharacterized protein A1O3_03230 [Capronia epimyces CBS 606.96]EXJ90161.1 hypothetical protein A1O3_03230 [Capronia epimyces CBS 606.96]